MSIHFCWKKKKNNSKKKQKKNKKTTLFGAVKIFTVHTSDSQWSKVSSWKNLIRLLRCDVQADLSVLDTSEGIFWCCLESYELYMPRIHCIPAWSAWSMGSWPSHSGVVHFNIVNRAFLWSLYVKSVQNLQGAYVLRWMDSSEKVFWLFCNEGQLL